MFPRPFFRFPSSSLRFLSLQITEMARNSGFTIRHTSSLPEKAQEQNIRFKHSSTIRGIECITTVDHARAYVVLRGNPSRVIARNTIEGAWKEAWETLHILTSNQTPHATVPEMWPGLAGVLGIAQPKVDNGQGPHTPPSKPPTESLESTAEPHTLPSKPPTESLQSTAEPHTPPSNPPTELLQSTPSNPPFRGTPRVMGAELVAELELQNVPFQQLLFSDPKERRLAVPVRFSPNVHVTALGRFASAEHKFPIGYQIMRTIVGRTYYLTVQSDTEFDVRTDHISICASEQLFHALQRAYQNRATLEPARAEEFMGMLDPRVKGWLKAMRRKDVGEEMPSASPDPYSDQQRNMCREHTPPNQPRNATHLATDTPCPQPVGQMHRKQVAQGHDAPFRQHELESFLNMLALPLSPEPTPSPSKKVLNKFGQKGKSVFPAGSDSQNDQEAPWEPDYDLTPHLPCGPAPHSGSFFSVSPASTGSLEKHYSHHVARVSSLFALEFASLNKIESEAQALRAQHQGLCALLPSYVFDDARGDVSKIKAKRTYSQRERLLIKEVKELEWRTRECDDEFKREYARVEGLLK